MVKVSLPKFKYKVAYSAGSDSNITYDLLMKDNNGWQSLPLFMKSAYLERLSL